MRFQRGIRGLGALVSACLLTGVLAGLTPSVALADDPLSPPATVTINNGNDWTNNPIVSVGIPFPTDSSGQIRLSNDDSSWSSPQSWQSPVAWDITDSSTGGTTPDGLKTVHVQWFDGVNWTDAGNDSVNLDTQAPQPSVNLLCHYTSGWIAQHSCWGVSDWGLYNSTGPDAIEFSLDGGPWTNELEVPGDGFDFRTPMWGGNWSPNQTVCFRAHDLAGNIGSQVCPNYVLNLPDQTGSVWNIRMELPLPAVTGQPFTLRPIFPDGFPFSSLPSTTLCEWRLQWGDLNPQTHYIDVNKDFGSVWMDHLYSKGGCGEWTFTLPYTPGLTYEYEFTIYGYWDTNEIGAAGGHTGTMIRATVGTTDRGIPHSTLGLAYILPDQDEVRPGEPATYHLYASDTPNFSLKAAYWWAYNAIDNPCGSLFGPDTPNTDTTFTYTPDCQGSWKTGWTWENNTSHEYLRAEYDPPADKAAPKVTAPQASSPIGGQISTTLPTVVRWTSADPVAKTVSTGVAGNQLQMSRNGGTWTNVTLSSPLATSVTLNLSPSGTYRFRARAWDSVGNRSKWVKGPVLSPRLLEQSAASLTGVWATVSSSSLSGGTAADSSAAGASATLTFTGRGISLIGSVGAGQGLAQIRVDGVLVQTIDLNAVSGADRSVLFSRVLATAGPHTLKITCLGTYRRPAINIDAFAVY